MKRTKRIEKNREGKRLLEIETRRQVERSRKRKKLLEIHTRRQIEKKKEIVINKETDREKDRDCYKQGNR